MDGDKEVISSCDKFLLRSNCDNEKEEKLTRKAAKEMEQCKEFWEELKDWAL